MPADTCAGLYGPRFQIGLIWNTPAMMAISPNTTANQPPPLAANVGRMRMPMTLFSVARGPGNWVCFWNHTRATCSPINASSSPGISRMCSE